MKDEYDPEEIFPRMDDAATVTAYLFVLLSLCVMAFLCYLLEWN